MGTVLPTQRRRSRLSCPWSCEICSVLRWATARQAQAWSPLLRRRTPAETTTPTDPTRPIFIRLRSSTCLAGRAADACGSWGLVVRTAGTQGLRAHRVEGRRVAKVWAGLSGCDRARDRASATRALGLPWTCGRSPPLDWTSDRRLGMGALRRPSGRERAARASGHPTLCLGRGADSRAACQR